MAWQKLNYVKQQYDFLKDDNRLIVMRCGRRSGKSETLWRKIIGRCATEGNNRNYAIFEPTHGQADLILHSKLNLFDIPFVRKFNKQDAYFEFTNGNRLYIGSAEASDRYVGIDWYGVVIDEACDCSRDSFYIDIYPAVSRVRGFVYIGGTPKRTGKGAEWVRELELKIETGALKGSTYRWGSAVTLHPDELEIHKATSNDKDFREQYLGEWVTSGGSVYYAFSVDNIKTVEIPSYTQILVTGWDFNVDWYSITIGYFINDTYYVFDEIRESDCNTRKALDILFEKYGVYTIIGYGDATSNSRKTSAEVTDYIQIQNDKRFNKGKGIINRIPFQKQNPSIVARVEAVNDYLCSASGRRRLFIDPRCKNLIKDFEFVSWKKDAKYREQDNTVKALTHMSDACGYVIYWKNQEVKSPVFVNKVKPLKRFI